MQYRKFNDKEIKQICKNMVILIDTREKSFKNISDWLEYKNRCEYKKIKLDNGDYSFMVKAIPELGITNNLYFDKKYVIERKKSLDELAGNFGKGRTRFEEELGTFKGKMDIVIQDSWDNLYQGIYNSDYGRKSFISTISSFEHRYDVSFKFISSEAIPVYIFSSCYYYLREMLKG